MRKPFFWKSRQAWYVKSPNHRRNIRLHEDEETAHRIWMEMVSVENADAVVACVFAIAERFLQFAKRDVAESTYSFYSYYVARFCNEYGNQLARDIKPHHVTTWIGANPQWKASSQRAAITSVKRLFSWAHTEGYLPHNSLVKVKRPATQRREVTITTEQHEAMIQRCRQEKRRGGVFVPILIGLKHSGCRPGSLAQVRIEDVTPAVDRWVLQQHKTAKKTGRPLVTYLSPCLATLTKIAMHGRQNGALFRNSHAAPWTRNAIQLRFKRLREKLGLPAGIVAYAGRHTFVTRALLNGVDIATVAELCGHTSTAMISRHYGHLADAPEHLIRAVEKAVR